MSLKSSVLKLFGNEDALNEELAQFKNKGEFTATDKTLQARKGEGREFIDPGFGVTTSSFNIFYRDYINKSHKNEIQKIYNYRNIAEMPEIADVIEDAVVESAQEDLDGFTVHLDIQDEKLKQNKNIVETLEEEFNNFFYNTLKINHVLPDLLRTYYIDGRMYYERLIDVRDPKKGIVGIKKLPSETMTYDFDYETGTITKFYQFLNPDIAASGNVPINKDVAVKSKELVVFDPDQIGMIDYGIYGKARVDVYGYLEKVKIPYNQLKLLETSVVIYRIIRAPERFVFKIDTGAMPKDKALKYVEKIKTSFQKKQSYDPSTGRLTGDVDVLSVLDNFFLPVSDGGRGSEITTVGGASTAGFTDLNDIYYFQRKLYQSLKYPMSRITSMQNHSEGDILFNKNPTGEIARDEVKWAVFLERQQARFCYEFLKLFLLHLEFKGLKKEYDLSKDNINITMNPPSYFRERQEQTMRETRTANYLSLANQPEMSKSFLMKETLEWTEEKIKENALGLKQDVQLGFRAPEETGIPGGAPAQGLEELPEADVKK